MELKKIFRQVSKVFLPVLMVGLIGCDSTANKEELGYNQAYTYLYGGIKKITFQEIDGVKIIEGDIAIPENRIFYNPSMAPRSIVRTYPLWTGAIVYYQIANDVYDRQVILDAISHIESQTAIKFVNSTGSGNYIEVIPSSGSWSYVGMIGNKQQLGLADWATAGTAVHEFCHALGVEHEHCRADRDQYVIIHWDNITDGSSYNFDKYDDAVHEDVGSFDFDSIMLYSSWAFSSNGRATITKLDGSTYSTQRDALSEGDIAGIEYLYPGGVGIHSPDPGSVLDASQVVFKWNGSNTSYYLYAGTTKGGSDLFNSGELVNQFEISVGNLPTDGSTVYVRLWYWTGQWEYKDYTYKTGGVGMTSPIPGSQLDSTSAMFEWSGEASLFWLYIGTSPGSSNIYNSGNLGTQKSVTVSGLPSGGTSFFVRLWYYKDGGWNYNDYEYIGTAF